MAMSYTWNENTPADTDLISSGDDVIRELKKAVRERLDVEHVFTTGNEGNVGEHAPSFITAAKGYLADSAVETAKIAALAVTDAKIADGTITEGKLDAAVSAQLVTNGDTHDHNGGDGAQIDHINLANIGSNTHATIDTHIASFTTSGHVTGGSAHAHSAGDGGTISHTNLSDKGTNTHAQIDAFIAANSGFVPDTNETILYAGAPGMALTDIAIDISPYNPATATAKAAVLCIYGSLALNNNLDQNAMLVTVKKFGGTRVAGGLTVYAIYGGSYENITGAGYATVIVPLDASERFTYSIAFESTQVQIGNHSVQISLVGVFA